MKKDILKIILIGHVDHGKSTLIGRLLLETNSLPNGKMTEIKKASKELGSKMKLAFLVDQLKEERKQNITIDTTQVFFKTPKRNYLIIDAPGHLKFIKNMITGVTQAEAAVLIIDVKQGLMEQTRRHAYIISLLGINKLIVVFNKMDLVGYKEEQFVKVKNELLQLLNDLGIKACFTVPVSAEKGSNICKKSSRMSWYQGPTLISALDSLRLSPRLEKKFLRFPIQDIYQINNQTIIMGRIASGIIKKAQKVIILPSLKQATVHSIMLFGKNNQAKAASGESIGITLNTSLSVQRGQIIVQKENLPELTTRFKAKIFWLLKKPLQIGTTMTLRCSTQEVECVVEKIEERINSSTLETLQLNTQELQENEIGIVILKTKKLLIIEKFAIIEELGRFILEQQTQVCAGGIIT